MPRVHVEFSQLRSVGSSCGGVSRRVALLRDELRSNVSRLDWDIKFAGDIRATADRISQRLDEYAAALRKYQEFIEDACRQYTQLNEYEPGFAEESGPSIGDFSIPRLIPDIFHLVGPGGALSRPPLNIIPLVIGLAFCTSGVATGNTPSFVDSSRKPSADASLSGPGISTKVKANEASVTAWGGKASAQAQNEAAYAEVNAYAGKASAKAGINLQGKMSINGEFEEVVAGVGASVSASILAADAKAGVGTDMLGAEVSAEGGVGNAEAKGDVNVHISKDGVTAVAEGKALVSAVSGKVKGTVNILGIEITAKAGGYAGAVGVEGKAGIVDNKFVLEGGAAAGVGGSAGIEIGFNDEGWSNFVDFITFWD